MSEYIGWLDEDWNIVLDQSQEIIRCRDCMRFPMCDLNPLGGDVNPEGFCSWGERKEVKE